jgi:hypothetical protein
MSGFDVKFPKLLAQLHALDVDYDESGMDFEPYQEFQSADDNSDWIHAWTGNQQLDGAEYRIFGQDGTGGYAAFWMVRKDKPVLDQPIVFFGSEGELGVVARNFDEYLWLLAGGVGPYEAIAYGADEGEPVEVLRQFAAHHAADAEKSADAVLGAAKKEFPDFEKKIRALCK